MPTINTFTGAVARFCLSPFEGVSPWITLTFWSAAAGVLMMIVFRYTSNQRALRQVGDRIRANLLAMRLFKDEVSVTFSCQWELLKALGARLWYSLVPLAVMVVPFVLGLAQLAAYFEHRPFLPGESAVVSLRVDERAWEQAAARLHAPDDVRVDTPPLRDRAGRTIRWRVTPLVEGTYTLSFQIDGRSITKLLSAGEGLVPVSPRRPGDDFWQQLLYPVEVPAARDGPITGIELACPQREMKVFGWSVHWLISFLVLSIVFGLVFKPLLRVHL